MISRTIFLSQRNEYTEKKDYTAGKPDAEVYRPIPVSSFNAEQPIHQASATGQELVGKPLRPKTPQHILPSLSQTD